MQVREEAERPRTPLVAFFSILLRLQTSATAIIPAGSICYRL